MERVKYLKKKLSQFEEKGVFKKKFGIRRLASNHLERARHNLVFANATYTLSESKEAKHAVKIDPAYSAYDWVIVSAYYAMYHAVLSCLARLGYHSKNHAAAIMALEYFFVHRQKKLEKHYVELIEKIKKLENQYAKMVWRGKDTRETAQYKVDKDTSKRMAELALENAREFVHRIAELHKEIEKKWMDME